MSVSLLGFFENFDWMFLNVCSSLSANLLSLTRILAFGNNFTYKINIYCTCSSLNERKASLYTCLKCLVEIWGKSCSRKSNQISLCWEDWEIAISLIIVVCISFLALLLATCAIMFASYSPIAFLTGKDVFVTFVQLMIYTTYYSLASFLFCDEIVSFPKIWM